MTGYSTEPLTFNGLTYLSNLKGWLGNVSYKRMSTQYIMKEYTNDVGRLDIKGIYITGFGDDTSPLLHPLDGAEPLSPWDIITAISFPDGVCPPIPVDTETVQIGVSDFQIPIGAALWNYNPNDDNNNIATLKVIYRPSVNSKETRIRVRLNQIPPVEAPPNRNTNLSGGVLPDRFFTFRPTPYTDEINSDVNMFNIGVYDGIVNSSVPILISMTDSNTINVINGPSPTSITTECRQENPSRWYYNTRLLPGFVQSDKTGPYMTKVNYNGEGPTGPTNPDGTITQPVPFSGNGFLLNQDANLTVTLTIDQPTIPGPRYVKAIGVTGSIPKYTIPPPNDIFGLTGPDNKGLYVNYTPYIGLDNGSVGVNFNLSPIDWNLSNNIGGISFYEEITKFPLEYTDIFKVSLLYSINGGGPIYTGTATDCAVTNNTSSNVKLKKMSDSGTQIIYSILQQYDWGTIL